MRYKALSSALLTCVLTGGDVNAIAAPSVRTANVKATTPTTAVRAGTLKTQPGKSVSASTPARATSQITANPVEVGDSSERMPMIKGIKNSNVNTLKDTAAKTQLLNQLDSRINELTEKIDNAEAVQNTVITESNIKANIESMTYTKDEINALIAESEQKEPKIDERGNWIDPNGNLIVVPVDAIVIGPNDITIVDGKLSTTSTHPIQNKAVTKALNEKQGKSTNLSFGNANGGWTPVSVGSDYIELYTNPAGSKEFRIRPTMITNSLENMENEDQLITAGAVQEAIAAITANPGSGTQQSHYFNLINLQTRYGELVQEYLYETNASESEILNFALNFCGGNFSDKWCSLCATDDNNTFRILKRQEGHTVTNVNIQSGFIITEYAVNLPDGILPQTYVNEYLCANVSPCAIGSVEYMGDTAAGGIINCFDMPIHFIQTISR